MKMLMPDSTNTKPTAKAAGNEPKSIVRHWRVLLRMLARRIEHEDVIDHVREEGHLSGRFIFMTAMSCAIATLGLLLSSPAVIIGAMLVSPLMGPIMLMGFSFSVLDLISLRRAVVTLFCGMVVALAISFLIVKASPLTDATPEILARTRPNFFDLLVAVFSGLAGGYAVINRKGETIVGVAIATALMPPLAVTGYGLAVGALPFAMGSFGLFMTNLLAISLSVTGLARLYSFGRNHSRTTSLWQTAAIFLVFGALSVPLGLALKNIAYEANVTNIVKSNLLGPFNGHRSRIGDVNIAFPEDGQIVIDATVMTRQRVPDAQSRLEAFFKSRMEDDIVLNLDQVLVDEDKALEQQELLKMAESSLAAPLRAEILELQSLAALQRTELNLRNAIAFPTSSVDIDPTSRRAVIVAAPSERFKLPAWRGMEAGLRTSFPDWKISVQPPVMELPLVWFSEGEEAPTDEGIRALDDIAWALSRWQVTSVEAVGYASTAGATRRFDNGELAFRRAETVAVLLIEQGFKVTPLGEYRAFRQTQDEQRLGRQRFQSVAVRPRSPNPLQPETVQPDVIQQ